MGELTRPRALLLDFGGVVVTTTGKPGWHERLAGEIAGRLDRIPGVGLPAGRIAVDIRNGADADSRWKDAMSRPAEPRELTHREFWADFVAADWPAPARAWVTVEATALCRRMGELRRDREFRPGLAGLLDAADAHGVPVGVVSNALCGIVHRDHLEHGGLSGRFAVQVYSDEVGIRKPNPRILGLAAEALGVPVGSAWYVGDNYDRDVLCARRAGAGAAILVEDDGTFCPPYPPQVAPDVQVPDLAALHRLLDTTCKGRP
ncbi:HAD family hydrolase [Amycolatopsis jejuensis]|uniref:HAD family hydrolase n=1 Tax=Amycolatopsis jejuensis TaxID=330084 RepID=UPI0005272E87|nr:HAD family hydrolase [Amycolatopsis jejuensis]